MPSRSSTSRRVRGRSSSMPSPFAFYVEGPSDQQILRSWARRLSPKLARALESCSVILGGRQPARAIRHFRSLRDELGDARGLCVLDRDDSIDRAVHDAEEAGLEFFTWPRRHIESYLLVPDAIRRSAGAARRDGRTERILREHLPSAGDEAELARVDAKRILAPNGSLSKALGVQLSAGRVARSLRAEELHLDVVSLFERLGAELGFTDAPARRSASEASQRPRARRADLSFS